MLAGVQAFLNEQLMFQACHSGVGVARETSAKGVALDLQVLAGVQTLLDEQLVFQACHSVCEHGV